MDKCSKVIFIVACISISVQISFAQKPQWVDSNYRGFQYPRDSFLVGFSTNKNTKNEPISKFMQIQLDHARFLLVSSIYSSVESTSTLNIEATNDEVYQKFTQSSTSSTKMDVVGLVSQQYYDKKKRTGYAFVYVKIQDLVDFYKTEIIQQKTNVYLNIRKAEKAQKNGDLKNVYQAYFACLPLINSLENYQTILMALGEKGGTSLYIEDINKLKKIVSDELLTIEKKEKNNLDEVCMFLTYQILSVEGIKSIVLGRFTYENTEMTSEFSERLISGLEKNLTEISNYSINRAVNNHSLPTDTCTFLMNGTFQQEDETYLRINSFLKNAITGEILVSTEVLLSLSWFSEKGISYIPEYYGKIALLKNLKINALNAKFESSFKELEKKPLRVLVSSSNSRGENILLPNVPVNFYVKADNQFLGLAFTDEKGVGEFSLSTLQPTHNLKIIIAELDIAQYLDIDTDTDFYRTMKKKFPAIGAKFIVRILGPSIYFESKGAGDVLTSKIKEALAGNGCVFTNDYLKSDYYISTKTISRESSISHGVFFVYVDTAVSIVDMETGKEIYKNTFSQKGGGNSYKNASHKAFLKVAAQINEELFLQLKK